MIKAIETEYKGYLFRSRLEARWAVFFDALGIEWEYEPEGFDCDGIWYLPDFYLPGLETWIEVKPKTDHRPDNPVWEINGERLVMLCGDPYFDPTQAYMQTTRGDGYIRYDGNSEAASYEAYTEYDYLYRWCECPKCGKVGIEFDGRAGRLCKCIDKDKVYNVLTPRLLAAYTAARQARFEYGCKG